MAKKFSIGSSTVEDVTFLKIGGVIDEDNSLGRALKRIEGGTVIIDLSGVERINSCGVRDWVNWLNDLNSRDKKVILVRCSTCIVNQINLVNNFTGGGMVKSFFAPFYCPKCDLEELKLLQVEHFAGLAQPKAPQHRGQRCAEARCEMEFDDIEESYFAFIPRNTGEVVDDRLQHVIKSFSPSIKDRIKRLDTVEKSTDDSRNTSVSSQYSPLTVTKSSASLNHDPNDPLVATDQVKAMPLARRRSRTSLTLLGAALALVGAIAMYVAFVVIGS